jgi:hypothetical protein
MADGALARLPVLVTAGDARRARDGPGGYDGPGARWQAIRQN